MTIQTKDHFMPPICNYFMFVPIEGIHAGHDICKTDNGIETRCIQCNILIKSVSENSYTGRIWFADAFVTPTEDQYQGLRDLRDVKYDYRKVKGYEQVD